MAGFNAYAGLEAGNAQWNDGKEVYIFRMGYQMNFRA